MTTRHRRISKSQTSDGFTYLTKRILLNKARIAGRVAAKNAMEIMGYVITVQDGWVVKQHQDGSIEHLEQLQTV